MFRSYLAAALRNLARNKLYAGIGIFGLAIGLCSSLLVGLIVRNELTYDHFIPGYERTYLVATMLAPQGRAPDYNFHTHNRIAAVLKLKFREIEAITRVADEEVSLRRGNVDAKEKIYWADQNVFDVLPLTALSGDLGTALMRPDSIVLTKSIAQKYFGHGSPIGESLTIGDHVSTVTAVVDDLPFQGTQLETGIFASGLASYSRLQKEDSDPMNSAGSPGFFISVRTYLRLVPGASVSDLQRAMPAFMDTFWPRTDQPGLHASMELLRLDKVHLFPGLNPDIKNRLQITILIGALILLAACINFINLFTARSAQRAMEVGVRKATGAGRGALVLQFLGESLVYMLLATCVAVALVEVALPRVNAFLGVGAVFDYWRSLDLMACIVGGMIILGAITGVYPALVLSSIGAASVLKGKVAQSTGSSSRSNLVTLQFAVLIGLIIAAGVVYEQRKFAMQDALRVDTDDMLIVNAACNGAFTTELASLPGVRGVACAGREWLTETQFYNLRRRDGGALAVNLTTTDFGVFDLYGLKPLAGRFSSPTDAGGSTAQSSAHYVINVAAVARLGFSSPQAAIGQTLMLPLSPAAAATAGEIIGVVRDFSLGTVEQAIKPTIYHAWPDGYAIINIKLSGKQAPETLAAIDGLWTRTAGAAPIDRLFLNDYIRNLYFSILRQAQTFGIFCGLAILLACLGLIGLAAAAAERRTKEIGIRKAMGAGTGEVMRLLVWQFTKPVLWANLIAWPVAAFVMNRWLHGFAYHIDLNPWLFIAATALALVIALLTVSAHCYLVARAKPVTALRYE